MVILHKIDVLELKKWKRSRKENSRKGEDHGREAEESQPQKVLRDHIKTSRLISIGPELS